MQHRNPNGTVKRKANLKRKPNRYPIPGEVGGRLARALVKSVREAGFSLPITSHILCACSGGADSTALAVLLAKYGRRVGVKITLLHVNHGWRGRASDGDEAFTRKLAKRLCVDFVARKLGEKPAAGDSWEAHARGLRKAVFRSESAAHGGAPVFTAHSADDQAETRLWRLFTGAFAELGRGILVRHGVEVRPLLGVRREELRKFLREEKQTWREDASNSDPRFLRARMRQDLMPVIEKLFPRAIEAINRIDRDS